MGWNGIVVNHSKCLTVNYSSSNVNIRNLTSNRVTLMNAFIMEAINHGRQISFASVISLIVLNYTS